MSNAAYIGSLTSGHDFCQPTEIVSGSQNVFINNKPAARVGDICAAHDCEGSPFNHQSHIPIVVSGSQNVFINNKPAARVGDKVSCMGGFTSEIISGSENIFID